MSTHFLIERKGSNLDQMFAQQLRYLGYLVGT